MPCQVSLDKLIPSRKLLGEYRKFPKSSRYFPESDLVFWEAEITNRWWIEAKDLHWPEEFDSAN